MIGLALSLGGVQAQSFYTHPLTPEVKTLRCLVDGDFMRLPIIDLQGGSKLVISFDELGDVEQWISYRVVHCTADWEESAISELDFVDGFQPTRVTDVAPSYNTYVAYHHYRVAFPNDDVRLLLSGNYAVIFFHDDAPDDPIAVATFAVTEQEMFVGGTVSVNTEVDYKAGHQQLDCTVRWSTARFPHVDPAADLTLKVRQNNRRDTERTIRRPLRIQAGEAVYEHDRDLTFDAGNNYRRFEFVDERYATLGVEMVRYKAPYYYVWLRPDRVKAGGAYYYDQDQHGRFLIDAKRVDNADVESDYFLARFTLDATLKSGASGIYLTGDFTYGAFDETTAMTYDIESGRYEQTVLLKQGAYNYMYLVGDPADGGRMQTGPVEGDYYEAHNEYEVMIYYRPMGQRYDRLMGFGLFK